MGGSHDEFYDLEEVEALAKRKLKKPVSFGSRTCMLVAQSRRATLRCSGRVLPLLKRYCDAQSDMHAIAGI